MKTTITLVKEDIQTRKMGLHYEIVTYNDLVINFTPEALDEFIKDIKAIKENENKEQC